MAFGVLRSLGRSLAAATLAGCSFNATGLGQTGSGGQTDTGVDSTGVGSTGGAQTTVDPEPTTAADPSGDPVTSVDPGTTIPVDPTTTTDADPSTSTTDPSGTTTSTTSTTDGEGSSSTGDASTSTGCMEMTFYKDGDGDGYGDKDQVKMACAQPKDYVVDNTDCDDGNKMSHPGAQEICGMGDNDCDGKVDEYNPPINVDCGCDMFDRDGLLYHFCGDTQSWDNAKTKCVDRGAALTDDLDQAQHDWFLARLTELGAGVGSWWLGGRTEGDNAMFKWIDGAPIGGFQPWGVGYPLGFDDTDCLRLASPTTPVVANKWVDANCGEKRPYICKGPLP